MNANVVDGATLQAFSAELDEVRTLLDESLDGLYPPLLDLARAQVRDSAPYVRAAIVLATAVATPDTPELRRKRLLLGAALEMLAVALGIHQLLLLAPADDETLDKSLLGSTILAGDYCFSRAAVLAAGTDSPRVVEIFAQALKALSESNLRRHFAAHPAAPAGTADDSDLRRAGAEAAAELAGLPFSARAAALALADRLSSNLDWRAEDSAALPAAQRARWAAVAALRSRGSL